VILHVISHLTPGPLSWKERGQKIRKRGVKLLLDSLKPKGEANRGEASLIKFIPPFP
jgi:hypothetical protein